MTKYHVPIICPDQVVFFLTSINKLMFDHKPSKLFFKWTWFIVLPREIVVLQSKNPSLLCDTDKQPPSHIHIELEEAHIIVCSNFNNCTAKNKSMTTIMMIPNMIASMPFMHFVGIWCMPMAFVQDIHYSQLSLLLCHALQPCLELGLSFCLTRSFHFLSIYNVIN